MSLSLLGETQWVKGQHACNLHSNGLKNTRLMESTQVVRQMGQKGDNGESGQKYVGIFGTIIAVVM